MWKKLEEKEAKRRKGLLESFRSELVTIEVLLKQCHRRSYSNTTILHLTLEKRFGFYLNPTTQCKEKKL